MRKSKQRQVTKKAEERNAEIYEEFEQSFAEKIMKADTVPEGGISRIQLLEQMVHSMNSDIISSNLKYVGEMIQSIDEEDVIDSKKANS